MVRQGLRSVLDAYDDLQVRKPSVVPRLSRWSDLQPCVVVTHINILEMTGIEAMAQMKTKRPETIIVGISVNSEDNNIDGVKRAGAFFVKTRRWTRSLPSSGRNEFCAGRDQGETR